MEVVAKFRFTFKMLIPPFATVFTLEQILDFINNWKNDTDINIRSNPCFFEFYWTIFLVASTYASWLVLAVTAERYCVTDVLVCLLPCVHLELLPLQKEGGYVFATVYLSSCLSVCLLTTSVK